MGSVIFALGVVLLGFYGVTLFYLEARKNREFDERVAEDNKVAAKHVDLLDDLGVRIDALVHAQAAIEKRTDDVERAVKTKSSMAELGRGFK